jgi:hypothetical protein
MFQPFGGYAIELFLNRDVGHGCGRSCAIACSISGLSSDAMRVELLMRRGTACVGYDHPLVAKLEVEDAVVEQAAFHGHLVVGPHSILLVRKGKAS